eukprot:TRINITY_DN3606_c0_g1_i1.p2 TRINITY_DN3606_c0_g1~~TRINITY_DN3606_c0_g1_i1.p2  ORF type:complete len:225 (+),score=50.52 TRINITY_DN3606_c0_g1_i1:55-675(+)
MAVGVNGCVHKLLVGFRVLAVLALLLCLVAHVVTLYKSKKDTWYVDCSECKNPPPCPGDSAQSGGDRDCVKCCCGCTLKQEIFFYILRFYSLCFIVLALLAEAELDWFSQRRAAGQQPPFFLVLKYYWARGMLMVFVGFLTLESSVAPDDPTANDFAYGAGWTLLAIGGVYVLLSLIPGLTRSRDERTAMHQGARQLQSGSPPRRR